MDGILDDLSASPGGTARRAGAPGVWARMGQLGIDLASIAIMLVGAFRFIIGFTRAEVSGDPLERVKSIDWQRMELGRYILSALELLIVSDIIHTALSLALADLLFPLLVLIRSMISFFLNREIRRSGAGSTGEPISYGSLLLAHLVGKTVRDEEDDRGEQAGDQPERPIGRRDRQAERPGDPDHGRLDTLHVEAALEDHRAPEEADAGEKP